MSVENKKVLMVSYIFPPLGSGANQRTVRFVKYLGCHGWTPIVLTVKNGFYKFRDDYFLHMIPDRVKVYRVFSLECARVEPYLRPLKRVLLFFLRIFIKRVPDSVTLDAESSLVVDSDVDNVRRSEKYTAKKLKDKYVKLQEALKMYAYIPDGRVGWIPFAVLKGLKIIYREKPSIIWACADTPSDLLIGFILEKITKKKLVVNFSDPWVLSPVYPFPKNSLRLRIDAFLERIVISAANRVVFATDPIRLQYEANYVNNAHKFLTVNNGYDPDEFIEEPPISNQGKFTLTYTGTLQYFRNPASFIKAVEELLEENVKYISRFKVNFVGKIDNECLRYFRKFKYGDVFRMVGQVCYKEALKYVLGADACLIIQNDKTMIPGKIYEHMAARRPILVISRESDAVSKLVRELNVGLVANSDDVESIKSAILKLIEKKDDDSFYKGKEKLIEKYSRKVLTHKLATCFDDLA